MKDGRRKPPDNRIIFFVEGIETTWKGAPSLRRVRVVKDHLQVAHGTINSDESTLAKRIVKKALIEPSRRVIVGESG